MTWLNMLDQKERTNELGACAYSASDLGIHTRLPRNAFASICQSLLSAGTAACGGALSALRVVAS